MPRVQQPILGSNFGPSTAAGARHAHGRRSSSSGSSSARSQRRGVTTSPTVTPAAPKQATMPSPSSLGRSSSYQLIIEDTQLPRWGTSLQRAELTMSCVDAVAAWPGRARATRSFQLGGPGPPGAGPGQLRRVQFAGKQGRASFVPFLGGRVSQVPVPRDQRAAPYCSARLRAG